MRKEPPATKGWRRSTSRPSSSAPTAARASPGPMALATSRGVTPSGKPRALPSGRTSSTCFALSDMIFSGSAGAPAEVDGW